MKWRRPESSLLGQLDFTLTLMKRRRIFLTSDGSCTGCTHEERVANFKEFALVLFCEDFGRYTNVAMNCSESLLLLINNGLLSGDTIEMGEALGTRPLISSKSRCIRSQTTQMQCQGLRRRGVKEYVVLTGCQSCHWRVPLSGVSEDCASTLSLYARSTGPSTSRASPA